MPNGRPKLTLDKLIKRQKKSKKRELQKALKRLYDRDWPRVFARCRYESNVLEQWAEEMYKPDTEFKGPYIEENPHDPQESTE